MASYPQSAIPAPTAAPLAWPQQHLSCWLTGSLPRRLLIAARLAVGGDNVFELVWESMCLRSFATSGFAGHSPDGPARYRRRSCDLQARAASTLL